MKFKSEVQLEALNNATVDTDRFLVSDSSTVKYRTGSQLLSDLGVSGLYVPYTGAIGNVDLGTHTLSSYNLIVNHTSGSGVAASITKGGNGEALTINKTNGSGNAVSVLGGLTSLVNLTLSSILNATIDTDRFIVSDGGAIKYRTGAQVLSDIGGQAALTNPITGTGTLNFVSKFTGASTIGNSLIYDNGINVGIGTTSPYSKLDVTDYTAYLSLSSGINSEATSPNQQIGGIDFRKHYGLAIGTSIRQLQSGGVNNYSYAHLAFYTNNGEVAFGSVPPERMRITSEGNVGIGTSTPSAKLESYKGSQSDIISRANASAYFWGADIGLAIGQSQSSPFGTWIQSLKHDNNATFPLSLNPNGSNVGIGTTTPQSALSIGTNHGTLISIGQPLWANNIVLRTSWDGSDFTQLLVPSNGANTAAITLRNSGNVGIGTTSPTNKLIVDSNVNSADGIVCRNLTTGASGYTFVGAFNNSNNGVDLRSFPSTNSALPSTSVVASSSGQTGGLIISQAGANPIRFNTNGSERMRISSTGEVGIGTSSPGVRFVNSGGAFSSGPTLGSGVIGSQALLSNNGLYGMYSGVSTNGDVWHQVQRNDGNTAVYSLALQPSGGNIYIGTNAPIYGTSAKMQFLFNGLTEFGINFRSTAVNSIPIHFTSSTGTQTGYIFQDATSVAFISVSDYRLKEDLKSFNALDLISRINVYDYKWKSQDKRSFGVMAHELQEVIPQAAFGEKDGEKMQGVDYSALVPILIQAIKELQTQIEELKILINK